MHTSPLFRADGEKFTIEKLTILCIGLVFLLAIGGCSNDNPLGRLPMTGTVTFEGQPLDQGTIQFTPQGQQGIGTGAVISNGQYSIPTEKGLPPGQYKVMIFSAKLDASASEMPEEEPEAPGSSELMPERIPPDFNVQSKQIVEVAADKDNTFDFSIP